MPNYGIILGSNVGDRQAYLKRALDLMTERLTDGFPMRIGSMFETSPVDCPDGSGSFYNAYVEIQSSDEPLAALQTLRAIEAELGRANHHERNAPRTIDLDIIYADDLVMDHPDLVIPHPRALERRFVLQLLAAGNPSLVLPGQTQTVHELFEALPEDGSQVTEITDEWSFS